MISPSGYPVVPKSKAVSLILKVQSLRDSGHVSSSQDIRKLIDAETEIRGKDHYPAELAKRLAAKLQSHFKTMKRNELEEFYITEVCPELETLPIEALQDPDHWRWLAISEFWDYIVRLEGELKESHFGGAKDSQLDRWVLLRGYRWFLRTRKGDDLSLATELREIREANLGSGKGVRDEYQSQVVRPNLSMHEGAGPAMVRAICNFDAFLEEQDGIQILRGQFGPSVRRLMENTYAAALDEDELLGVFASQYPATNND